jgi:hypothetical protein
MSSRKLLAKGLFKPAAEQQAHWPWVPGHAISGLGETAARSPMPIIGRDPKRKTGPEYAALLAAGRLAIDEQTGPHIFTIPEMFARKLIPALRTPLILAPVTRRGALLERRLA